MTLDLLTLMMIIWLVIIQLLTSSSLILIVSFKISLKLQIWNFKVSIWAMWLDHSSLWFTRRQTDIDSIESSIRSSKFIASSSEINNFSKFFLVWRFRRRQCIVSCSSCSFISACHKVSSRALLSLNLWAASAQSCCSFWNFACAATSAAEKGLDLPALSLGMPSSSFQYSERNDGSGESGRERLSGEGSGRRGSEGNWGSEGENCSGGEGCRGVEGNRGSSTSGGMRACLRRRPGGAARSVVFGCSARVVGFLRLPDALEGVRGSSRDRFWLRRWGNSNKNGYKNVRNVNKQRGLNSFNFGQLGGGGVEFSNSPYKRDVG